MNPKEHPCFGCCHWRGEHYNGYTCNYIFDTGHVRPCPPGAGCTVRNEDPARRKGNRYQKRKPRKTK